MRELPEGWAEGTTLEVCTSETSPILTGPFGSNLGKDDFRSSGVPVFTIGALGRETILRDKLRYIGEEKAEELPAYRLRRGDLLFSRMADVGRVGFVPDDLEGSIFNYHIMRLRLDDEVVEPKFFQYYVQGAERVTEYLKSVNRGATRDGINTKLLQAMPVAVPPLPEQRRIVAKLDWISARSSAARDHLARTIKLATRAKQAILDAETVKGTTDCDTLPVVMLADVMFDGPFGSNLKSKDYTAEGVRVVRLENIGVMEFRAEKITFISDEKYETLQRHTLAPDDIVFSSFVADNVRAALIPADLGTAINKADCFCVRCDRNIIEPKYLLFRLSARQTYQDMEEMVHGATRPRIGLKHLKAYEIAVPPLERQQEIVRRIESAFARIDRMTEEASRAAHLLDRLDERLLAKTFRGELVPQDPGDEPAEALLTRIREARAAAPKAKRGHRKKAEA
tara:strand:- start:4445 stop:5803 length:1359 start_codon:yes stop_codon:yes gene_type:complete